MIGKGSGRTPTQNSYEGDGGRVATATKKTFAVTGFHCTGCANNLGSALNNLDGVIRARADFEEGYVEVRFDPDRVTEEDVRERIRASGFEPD